MQHVTVSNSRSVAIGIYNVAFYVRVNSCNILNASSDELNVMSGNVIAYNNIVRDKTTVKVSNSLFSNSGYSNLSRCVYTNYSAFSYSSGLALFLNNSNVSAIISSTNLSNNTGCTGGNMALVLAAYSNFTVTIEDTNFSYGKAYVGGGLSMTAQDSFHVPFALDTPNDNSSWPKVAVNILNSTFISNYAERYGGGISIEWKEALAVKKILDMVINGSTFINNSMGTNGSGGIALHYKTYIDFGSDPHNFVKYRLNLNLSHCIFQLHSLNAASDKENVLSGSSVILVKSAPYIGINSTEISSNNCTALLAIASTLVFYGSSKIYNNSALAGAGIRLCSRSLILYFTPHMKLAITNNFAEERGGGILVNSNCLVNKPMCFYQYALEIIKNMSLMKTINVTVKDNHAPNGGENIYGGSLDYCYLLSLTSRITKRQIHIYTHKNTDDMPSSISSNPQHICFKNQTFNCSKTTQYSIYPGQNVTYSLRVVGQQNGAVSGTVSTTTGGSASINSGDKVKALPINGSNLTYKIYSINSMTSSSGEGKLIFKAELDSDTSVHEHVQRFAPAEAIIKFKDCPFGFVKTKTAADGYECSCHSDKIPAIRSCLVGNKTTITKYPEQWIGCYISNHSYFATGTCSLDYCNSVVSITTTNHTCLDEDKQCQYNRTGILCGSCPTGWSLVLGTSECRKHCSNLWLLLVVPFALAGLLLVFFIHYLNLTVTIGTVSGLIFYGNVIQDYSITLLSTHPIPILTTFLKVFLAWLNLDLGVATCFYNGMGAFGKTILQGLFPLYISVISATIIVVSNRYISVTRVAGNNAVKVLATLFLLSFSKMLRVTIHSLNLKYVDIWINSTHPVTKVAWTLDGNIPYLHSSYHLSLVIVAIFCLIISLPFSTFLLCIKHAYFLSTLCRAFSWIDKLKPFTDAYTGPYKDNARFWTGLLLFARLLLLLAHTSNSIPLFVAMTLCLVLFAIMICLKGVYKNYYLNILECSFLLNIGIIFALSMGSSAQWKCLLAHILVCFAVLTFFGILARHIQLKCCSNHCLRKLALRHRHGYSSFDATGCEGMRGYDNVAESCGCRDDDTIGTNRVMIHFPSLYSNKVCGNS